MSSETSDSKTISIQGNVGSFSHIAAESFFGKNIILLERDTFVEVFDDVHFKRAEYAVLPIENSTYGSVYQNFDLLTKNRLHITGEIYLIINFHLIAFKGIDFHNITELYSHPVALGQIRNFLELNPKIRNVEYPDTAGAVKMIKDKKMLHAAGAASRRAAETYGMEIIKEKIQDNSKNYTRFFVLSPNEDLSTKANKTTLQFELGAEPAGLLHKALEIFAKENISLTKIESRPIHHTDWEYRFYIDVMKGIDNPVMIECLKKLIKAVRNLRILGSYEKGKYIET